MHNRTFIISFFIGIAVAFVSVWLVLSGLIHFFIPPEWRVSVSEESVLVPASTELRVGSYLLEGYVGSLSSTPDYGGEVYIEKTGEVYKLTWYIGKQIQDGVGILEDDILSVGYIDGTLGDAGVVSYRVVPNERLEGVWSSILGTNTGREILTWQSGEIPVFDAENP